jgi:hypothetical protein
MSIRSDLAPERPIDRRRRATIEHRGTANSPFSLSTIG